MDDEYNKAIQESLNDEVERAIQASIQTKIVEDIYNKQQLSIKIYEYNPLPLNKHPDYDDNGYNMLEDTNQILLPTSLCQELYEFNELNNFDKSTKIVDESLMIFKGYKTDKQIDLEMDVISDKASVGFIESIKYCVMTMYDISGDNNIYLPLNLYNQLGLNEEPESIIKFKLANIIKEDGNDGDDKVLNGEKLILKPLNINEFNKIKDYKKFLEEGIMNSYKCISLNDNMKIGNNKFIVRKTEPSNIILLTDTDVEIEFVEISQPTKNIEDEQIDKLLGDTISKCKYTNNLDRMPNANEEPDNMEFKSFNGEGQQLSSELITADKISKDDIRSARLARLANRFN